MVQKYAKLDGSNFVLQTQLYSETGFVTCPDNVVSGYQYNDPNWDAPAAQVYTPDKEDIREECKRRMGLDGIDLLVTRELNGGTATTAANKTYYNDCVDACVTLEGTLPTDYLTSATWPTLPV